MNLIVFCDGAARGNPGPAAGAFIVKDEKGRILHEHSFYLGKATNNEAEYQALIAALEFLASDQFTSGNKNLSKKNWRIICNLDSKLVVEQLGGRFKVKDDRMRDFVLRVRILENNFGSVFYNWIRREKNKEVDLLVNIELDKKLKWS